MENSQALVIVPTVGEVQMLLECVQRLLECTTLEQWALTIVHNPVESTAESEPVLKNSVEAAVEAYNLTSGKQCSLSWLSLGEAVGWPRAVNAGVSHAMQDDRLPPHVCIMNDDVLVTPGWIAGMREVMDYPCIVMQSELAGGPQRVIPRDTEKYGKIGMVGPLTNNCAGHQRIIPPTIKMDNGVSFTMNGGALLDQFALQLRSEQQPPAMSASFLSGLCTLYRRECLEDLLEANGAKTTFLREEYGLGGYDDNDVAVRAQSLGWKLAISRANYVHHIGHATLDKYFPDADLGREKVAEYMRQWSHLTDREQRLIAVFRVGWSVAWDIAMFGTSLRRAMMFCDGVAILATSDPSQTIQNEEALQVARSLPPQEQKFIASCHQAGGDSAMLTQAIEEYVRAVANSMPLKHQIDWKVSFAEQVGNERDERNDAIELAMDLEPDWCISIDHDEVLEEKVTRSMMQRLMRHPDPLILSYDFGWRNLWDNDRLCRVDQPWADGYRSSMRGYRMWRVLSRENQKIIAGNEAGLHCGNIPDCGVASKRVAGLRWKHYGYLRHQDRLRKYARYVMQDPNPDSFATQGGAAPGSYNHLVHEERMVLQPYRPDTRIGLTMLVHKREKLHDLARHLTYAYALVDHIVFVWTEDDFVLPESLAYVTERYGVEWIHHPLADDISAARNVGVDRLRELGADWCWVMDPDEHLNPPLDSMISIRRMVEVSDGWAWLFRFKNFRPDGEWAISENVRLFRLAGGKLRYRNRVHETLEKDLHTMSHAGIHPQVRHAPFMVDHFGLSGDDERTQEKLFRYTRLLRLQIEDDPTESPGAWVSLGLQFGNDGDTKNQMRCYEVACATAGNAYLPYREFALTHLRIGKAFLRQAYEKLAPSHDLHGTTAKMIEVLEKLAPDQAVLGSARSGKAIPVDFSVDSLIDGAWQSIAAEGGAEASPKPEIYNLKVPDDQV